MSSAAPTEPLLRLRPLGLGEILDDVFRVYRRHFLLLFGIALLLALPSLVLALFSGSAGTFGFLLSVFPALFTNPDALSSRPPPPPPNLLLSLLGDVLAVVMIPFLLGAFSKAAIDLAQGRPVTIGSTLGGVLRRYWGLMGLVVLFALMSPLVLCFPVLIWLAIRWVVAIPAMLAEGVGPIRGLDRSWTLTRGHWWRLFGTLLVMYILQSVVGGALGVLGIPLAVALPIDSDILRGAIVLTVSTAAGAAVQPIISLCVVLLYFDLRIRHEAFDLDQLARQAVAPTA